MPTPCASELALKAAKQFVAYIEFFRTNGTGALMKRYPDDDAFGGYDNIVRRSYELAAACDGFDNRRRYREDDLITALKLARDEIHNPGTARAIGQDIDAVLESAIKAHGQPRLLAA